MKKVFKILLLVVLILAVSGYIYYKTAGLVHHYKPDIALAAQPAQGHLSEYKIFDSLGRGVEFLTAHQEKDGAFVYGTLAPHAAFTALSLDALIKLPEEFLTFQGDSYTTSLKSRIAKAQQALLKLAKDDGGIYSDIPGFSFGVYSTALTLVVLREAGVPESSPVIINAQKYLRAAQHTEAGLFKGGAGYSKGSRPDLNNTSNMLEALEASGLSKDDPAFKNAIEFLNNTQNRSESNKSGLPVTNDGGFVYYPGHSLAGVVKTRDGKSAAASYGTMSYAGLVSFLYAGVTKDDPRVKSAVRWISNNYDLHENVGLKDVGLFYYYRIMAKALGRYGKQYIVTKDGVLHDWAVELAATVIKHQRENGSWRNDNSKYLEGDDILVTAYALRTLEICCAQIQKNKSAASSLEVEQIKNEENRGN